MMDMDVMTWDVVMRDAIVPLLEADVLLVEALDGAPHIYTAQSSRPRRVPSVEWIVIGDRLTENFNPIDVQFDYWAHTPGDAATIERQLRRRLHFDVRRVIAGIDMSTLLEDANAPTEESDGVWHGLLRFVFEPVRSRQALTS